MAGKREVRPQPHLLLLRKVLKVWGEEHTFLSSLSMQEGEKMRHIKYSRTSLGYAVTYSVIFIIRRTH